jgi:hypothetical protein
MSYKKMPPQAYTKETLQEAFEWWNQQPDDFRDKVQDKDDLVGYYLKVRRGYPESDVSEVAKASFSSELKGLAKNLDDFEGYQSSNSQEKKRFAPPPVKTQVATPVQEPSVQLKFPDMTKSPVISESLEFDDGKKKPLVLNSSKEDLSNDGSNKYFKLDPKSLDSVRAVRKALNLSSDQEALRAIVALGASKISSLLP